MSETIAVEVQLFARLRKLCDDRARVSLELEAPADAEACFARLCAEYPSLAPQRKALVVAVNEDYAGWDRRLAAGDVVSFIPPVSGG
jgi:molybdopterin converting factor small subunit